MAEQFVPLNDADGSGPSLSRKSSFGSDKDLKLKGEGDQDSTEFRLSAVHAQDEKKRVSLWHDISLVHIDHSTKKSTNCYNFVCEIPKFTRKKFEIATDEEGTPIKQDTKKGKLREFKKGDIFFNYGCFPQTWEDPTFIHPDAEGCRGDNDPLDVCEIGSRIVPCGGIRPVKILGILCMIDEGECDWKVVTIDAEDKWAPFLNDIDDVEREMPGMLSAIREWYRTYKIPDGKPPNVFGLQERFMDKEYTMAVINECHQAWEELVSGSKERELDGHDDEVKNLVRNLSKGSLFALMENVDEHPEFDRPSDFDTKDAEDGIFF